VKDWKGKKEKTFYQSDWTVLINICNIANVTD
jgi:hypothetical protein